MAVIQIEIPKYLTEQTEEIIRENMLGNLPLELDKSEGSYIWDAISPVAIELAQAAIWAQEVLRRGFASTTFGEYLDMRCAEHGVTRNPAVKATGTVKFTGTKKAIIPVGTRVATPADPNTNTPSVEFKTVSGITLANDGQGHWLGQTGIKAVEAGSLGNMPVGSISVLIDSIPGVTGVINETATSGGVDTEIDSSLLARFLQRVRQPSTGGNKADYIAWATEVPGVGAASVVPVRDGAGTVSIAILNKNMEPADKLLVDSVQNYIAPPWIWEKEAEEMTSVGNGVSVDNTQPDVIGNSIKMVYNSAGNGTLYQSLLAANLPRPGIWRAKVRVKSSGGSGTQDLLELGVWNITGEGGTPCWCKISATGNIDAKITLKQNQLTSTLVEQIVDFYWNGQDEIQFKATRLISDTVTTVWIDRVVFQSKFSTDTGEGKAPIGATVTVEPASTVSIDISAILDLMPGYDADNVIPMIQGNIRSYLNSLIFAVDNDIRYSKIGDTIINTPGVRDYLNLRVNNGTSNVDIGVQQIAAVGEVALTT